MPLPETQHVIADFAVIDNKNVISPAHLVIENGCISKINSSIQKHPASATILKNHVLLPGFTNAHCHLELSSIGTLPQNSFFNWVKDLLQKKSDLTQTDIKRALCEGSQILLASGVTTAMDHVSPTTPSSIYAKLPLNVIVFGELAGLTPETLASNQKNLALQKKLSPVPYHISPHSVYALDPIAFRDFLNTRKQPLSIHMAESDDEKNYFESGKGDLAERIFELTEKKPHDSTSAFAFLKECSSSLEQILFVHGNDLNEKDLNTIAKLEKKCVVHCPGSFEFFNHKNFPFNEILARHIPVALGTDSLASNFSLNFLDEINRFLKKYPEVDFFELLPMLTINALTAIGISDRGKIAEGMMADLTGWRVQNDFEWKHFFNGRTRTDFVMCEGQIHLMSGVPG